MDGKSTSETLTPAKLVSLGFAGRSNAIRQMRFPGNRRTDWTTPDRHFLGTQRQFALRIPQFVHPLAAIRRFMGSAAEPNLFVDNHAAGICLARFRG